VFQKLNTNGNTTKSNVNLVNNSKVLKVSYSQHVKNEHLFAIKGSNYVTYIMFVRGLVGAKKQKFLHFVAMFWFLKLN
jgi:hypothetical protein